MEIAHQEKYITKSELEKLKNWREDPEKWK